MELFVHMDGNEFDEEYYFGNLLDKNHFTLHEIETELEHNILHTTSSSLPYPITSNTDLINTKWTSGIVTNDFQPSSTTPTSTILSFETNSTLLPANPQMLYGAPNDNEMGDFIVEDSYEKLQDLAFNNANQSGKPVSRSTSQGQPDHAIAERKRREKLNQRFVALSAVIPGLVKMDKGTVLEDAIRYIKQLQERVKVLEEQTKKRRVASVVLFKKSQISSDNESSSSNEVPNDQSNSRLSEVQVRVSDKEVLIRVLCQKQHGIVVEILNEIEKLHLTIRSSTLLPFGTSMVDITVICQTNDDFSVAINDVVKNLRRAFLQFM